MALVELPFEWEARLREEQLGLRKYPTNSRAFGELITNGFDAGASKIDILIEKNEIGGVGAVVVEDNGKGMTLGDIQMRFMRVGVEPAADSGTRFGRFGVGRFAVFRIGQASDWTTVTPAPGGLFKRCTFTLVTGATGKTVTINEETGVDGLRVGTRVRIRDVHDLRPDAAGISQLMNDLSSQFCGYLLGNESKQILVQGRPIDVCEVVESQEQEQLAEPGKPYGQATIRHILLKKSVDSTRFPRQLLFASKGRTITDLELTDAPAPSYLAIVDSTYLDRIVSADRAALVELDDGFHALKADTLSAVARFSSKIKDIRERTFIERARQQDFYPYRVPTSDPVTIAEQALYDVVLEKVHENVRLDSMTKKQQAVLFHLLQRAMANQDLLGILEQVAQLSETDIEQFRRVLEYTTLDSIIRLSSEVTARLHFLAVLQELTYADVSKHLKERSQLHKIVEPHCWIFGARFHLASSDRSFRTVIQRHRVEAGLGEIAEPSLSNTTEARDIPDLFLAARREYPAFPKHHHVLVELKSPSVTLSEKERSQAKRYALRVKESHEFDQQQTEWDVFLVSSCVAKDLDSERKQDKKPFGQLLDFGTVRVWAFSWGEIIDRARDEMALVREHLKRRSIELSVSDYLKKNFPNILDNLVQKGWVDPQAM